MDRDSDATIAKEIFGWKLTHVPPDYDGVNEGEILTENGAVPANYELPRKGKLHIGLLCRHYSSDWDTAIRLARHVGLVKQGWPLTPQELAENCLKFWRKSPTGRNAEEEGR